MKRHPLSTATAGLLLAGIYVLAGFVSKATGLLPDRVALVWVPAGVSLAAVVVFGYQIWWGIALGASAFAFARGLHFGAFAIATIIGNTVASVIGAYLLERITQFRRNFERVEDSVGFIVFASGLAGAVYALFAVLGRCYSGQVHWDALFSTVVIWWVPNALGVLIVAPVILAWSAPSPMKRSYPVVEALCCAAGLIAGTQLSFNSWFVNGIEKYPLAYLPYPCLIWAALRFGPRGGTLGTLLVAALSIHELAQQRGPFLAANEHTSLMLIACYMGITGIGNLLLASAAVERETALRNTAESERRYRGVVEDQSDLICRFWPDGTLTFVNEAYCRFYGKRREHLLGSNFFGGILEHDREIPLQEFNRLAPADPINSFDNKTTLPDGKILWQQCRVRGLFDAAGQPIEFQAVIQDITRRKESEEALRLGEERLRAILQSMVDGVVVLDGEGLITMMNPAAESIFQRPVKEVLGTCIKSLFKDENGRRYEDYFRLHLDHIPPKVIEFEAVLPNHSTRPIDFAASRISRGSAQMYIVVVRDISERKKLEEQFRQAQKMEAVGRLAGGIAHDFNNLMQAILGYINLLDRRLPKNDPNHETVGHIQKSLAHATSLTRQLLAFSRKQVLEPRVLSLNTIVADMEHLLRRTLGETVQLRLNLASPAPWIRADRGQIEQLILNLAINARDAMPEGGALGIETQNVEFNEPRPFSSGLLAAGPYAVLSISDTGCGMTAEVQSHLFEPFFTTKGLGKGTGLGLCNVYGIIKQTGGEIAVRTAPGAGTTFYIYLPRFQEQLQQEDSTQLLPASGGGNEVILLVEDEELVRMMLAEVLKTAGYSVLEASQGDQAIDIAERHQGPIHLLVTDMTMPGFSGSELARRLGQSRPAMRVLFISGYTDQEAAKWDQLNQPLQFLQKPFHPDAFLTKARYILDKNMV